MKPICTADVIPFYGSDSTLIIERLSSVPGLSLIGGKRDPGETLTGTAIREAWEEAGIAFVPQYVLGTYAEPGRDPRGDYVSTVFVGTATGTPRDEPGKTRVHIVRISNLPSLIPRFVFDHGKVVQDFLDHLHLFSH